MIWRRKWQPTPVFLPRKFHVKRSLTGYSPWGHKESDKAEHAPTKNMINTDEQLDKYVHTVKTGRIPFTGVSVPMKLGTPPSQ